MLHVCSYIINFRDDYAILKRVINYIDSLNSYTFFFISCKINTIKKYFSFNTVKFLISYILLLIYK